MKINLAGKEYEVNDTLRVAYDIQKELGNKSYSSIFEGLQTSNLEEQVKIVYVAFKLANPGVFTFKEFLDLVLDNWKLSELLMVLGQIIEALTQTGVKDGEKKIPAR